MSDLCTVLIEMSESLEVGVAIYSADGQPLYCNPAYRAVASSLRDGRADGEHEVTPGHWVRVKRQRSTAGLMLVTATRIPAPATAMAA